MVPFIAFPLAFASAFRVATQPRSAVASGGVMLFLIVPEVPHYAAYYVAVQCLPCSLTIQEGQITGQRAFVRLRAVGYGAAITLSIAWLSCTTSTGFVK